jgi:hypothetical protein
MKRKSMYNEESALANSEKWKILKWLWDNVENCPSIDSVTDVGAAEGTMTFVSANGEEYTLAITKGNWREL